MQHLEPTIELDGNWQPCRHGARGGLTFSTRDKLRRLLVSREGDATTQNWLAALHTLEACAPPAQRVAPVVRWTLCDLSRRALVDFLCENSADEFKDNEIEHALNGVVVDPNATFVAVCVESGAGQPSGSLWDWLVAQLRRPEPVTEALRDVLSKFAQILMWLPPAMVDSFAWDLATVGVSSDHARVTVLHEPQRLLSSFAATSSSSSPTLAAPPMQTLCEEIQAAMLLIGYQADAATATMLERVARTQSVQDALDALLANPTPTPRLARVLPVGVVLNPAPAAPTAGTTTTTTTRSNSTRQAAVLPPQSWVLIPHKRRKLTRATPTPAPRQRPVSRLVPSHSRRS